MHDDNRYLTATAFTCDRHRQPVAYQMRQATAQDTPVTKSVTDRLVRVRPARGSLCGEITKIISQR